MGLDSSQETITRKTLTLTVSYGASPGIDYGSPFWGFSYKRKRIGPHAALMCQAAADIYMKLITYST